MAKKKKKINKASITGRLGAEAALAVSRHNGAGPILSDKREITRSKARLQFLQDQFE